MYGAITLVLVDLSDILLPVDRDKHGTTRAKDEGDGEFEEGWFGRLVRPEHISTQHLGCMG